MSCQVNRCIATIGRLGDVNYKVNAISGVAVVAAGQYMHSSMLIFDFFGYDYSRTGYIAEASLKEHNAGILLKPSCKLWLFNSSTLTVAAGGTFSLGATTDLQLQQGIIDFDNANYLNMGSNYTVCYSKFTATNGKSPNFLISSSSLAMYGVLISEGSYDLTNSTIDIELKVIKD